MFQHYPTFYQYIEDFLILQKIRNVITHFIDAMSIT
jgi:hypothetical protein